MPSPDRHTFARRHRRAQGTIGAELLGLMALMWGIVDADDLDATSLIWLLAAQPLVSRYRRRSAELAAHYYTADRRLAGITEPFQPNLVADLPVEMLTRSLQITGPDKVRDVLQRVNVTDRAMQLGRDMSARAAVRHALNGGRDTIQRAVVDDPVAIGWARITDGDCCAFCAMLASRGPTYLEDNVLIAEDGDKYHDGCGCTAMAVYDNGEPLTAEAKRFRQLWERTTGGYTNRDKLNAFRRALAAQRRDEPVEESPVPQREQASTPMTVEQILAGVN